MRLSSGRASCRLILFALVAASGLAGAQTPILEANGDAGDDDDLGWSVAVAGDVDGDGHDDVLVGVKNDGATYNGGARLYSGADGIQLLSWVGADPYDRMGVAVAGVGDVNDDGAPDVLIGAPRQTLFGTWTGPGFAHLYSGADGRLIQRLDGDQHGDDFGACVAQMGDLNGDGRAEFVIGAPAFDTAQQSVGRLRVFNGDTLLPMYTFTGPLEWGLFGTSAADAGDVNLDGVPDILVGAPTPGAEPDGGHVYVYSGATGQLLLTVEGGSYDDYFGRAVCGLGDLNADGRADFAAGMPGFNRVLICSGATGAVLHTVQGKAASEFGWALAPAGDLDGDGLADLVVGAWRDDSPPSISPWNQGSVSIISSGDGSLMWRFFGSTDASSFGRALAGGGDLDADGHADLVIGEPGHGSAPGGQIGRAHGYSLHPWTGLGHGLAGAHLPPALWSEGSLVGGTSLKLRLAAAPASAPVALIVGFSALMAPFKGGTLVPNPDLIVAGLFASTAGQLTLSTTWPSGVPAGVELHMQAWVVDPAGRAGFSASPGVVGVTR
ncbi:MAG TPA: integrin alpha [Planctomycetota bacterium]|nr:integrin alpha [Planctomycetota bacterium]